MPKVSLVKCSSYDPEEIHSAVKTSIDLLGGISSFVKSGQKILIKPNILAPFKAERAATTHPAVVEAVIRQVLEAGANPCVGESPGVGKPEYAAQAAGILEVCKKHSVPFIGLNTQVEVNNPGAGRFKRIYMAREVLEAEAIINIPKFKTHGLLAVTGAVKNLFGCVPGITKSQYHYKVQRRAELGLLIMDIYRFLRDKVKLSIMDAVCAMEGEGPSAGAPYNLGLIGASGDALALDEAFCRIVGQNPQEVPTLYPLGKIEIKGEPLEKLRVHDFKTIEFLPESAFHLPIPAGLFNRLVQEKPQVVENLCIRCKTCILVCASGAITEGKNAVNINYDKCIRCLCCSEFCPEKAIRIRRNPLFLFFHKLLQKFSIP